MDLHVLVLLPNADGLVTLFSVWMAECRLIIAGSTPITGPLWMPRMQQRSNCSVTQGTFLSYFWTLARVLPRAYTNICPRRYDLGRVPSLAEAEPRRCALSLQRLSQGWSSDAKDAPTSTAWNDPP